MLFSAALTFGTALDAGAGTGFYSLLMAQSGVQVSALDVSSEMIRHLKANAKKKKLSLNARVGRFSDIRKIFTRKYDAVFCLGNSLPHLRTKRELYRSIKNFIHVLKPGGVLILQLLNYDHILKNRERILSVKENDKQIVVRFYDYGKTNILFNVLSLERKGTVWLPALQSIWLHPWRLAELKKLLTETGCCKIQVYNSLLLDRFQPSLLKDLILICSVR